HGPTELAVAAHRGADVEAAHGSADAAQAVAEHDAAAERRRALEQETRRRVRQTGAREQNSVVRNRRIAVAPQERAERILRVRATAARCAEVAARTRGAAA